MAEQFGGAHASEFRPEAAASDFEVRRAIDAYVPLLEACYAKAHQRPFAFPQGYEQIRASMTEMAEAARAEPP